MCALWGLTKKRGKKQFFPVSLSNLTRHTFWRPFLFRCSRLTFSDKRRVFTTFCCHDTGRASAVIIEWYNKNTPTLSIVHMPSLSTWWFEDEGSSSSNIVSGELHGCLQFSLSRQSSFLYHKSLKFRFSLDPLTFWSTTPRLSSTVMRSSDQTAASISI